MHNKRAIKKNRLIPLQGRIYREWFYILAPFLLGILTSILLQRSMETLPVLVARIDLASLILGMGAAITIIFGFLFLRGKRVQKNCDLQINKAVAEHRQFLLRLDHELKNPLSAIATRIASINSTVGNNDEVSGSSSETMIENPIEEVQKMVFQIDVQTQRIKRLVNDLRKLSELETCPIELSAVDITTVLENLYTDLKGDPACLDKKILLSLPATPWRLSEIWADEDLVYPMLQNLINNAVKYTNTQDTIEIRAYELRDWIIVEVADSGIGIPEDEIDKIGNELYRAKNSRGIQGNGLGLSIVKTIVKRLNGDFAIRSRDGEGTVVTITLPKHRG